MIEVVRLEVELQKRCFVVASLRGLLEGRDQRKTDYSKSNYKIKINKYIE